MKRLRYSYSDEDSTSTESEDEVTYYNGDLQMPIFSLNRSVLSPDDVIGVLHNVEHTLDTSRVYQCQPIGVERHCSFIVDLHSLKSCDDIKCDDVGSWQNNSCNKFQFVHHNGAFKLVEKDFLKELGMEEVSTLKRSYYSLKDDGGDFRRRIDTIYCKYQSL